MGKIYCIDWQKLLINKIGESLADETQNLCDWEWLESSALRHLLVLYKLNALLNLYFDDGDELSDSCAPWICIAGSGEKQSVFRLRNDF